MNKIEKAQKIERAIRITYDSLQSHLDGTHTATSTSKKYIQEIGSLDFHKKCVKEYADVIQILSELY